MLTENYTDLNATDARLRKLLIFAIVLGSILRIMLAAGNIFHPSEDLAYVQADNYMGAATWMRLHHDTTDPVFVPGYTFMLAVFQVVFGPHAAAFMLALECLVGIACIPMMYFMARRLGGPVCGAVTALLVAIDPLLIPRSSLILTESLYIPLLLAGVCLFIAGMTEPRQLSRLRAMILLSAVVAGCSVWVRSVGMVMPAAMVIALWFDRAIQARRRFFLGVGVCLLAFLIVLPLCLHNKHRYGYFNVSSSFKYNYAALIVGPAKKRMDGNDGPKLLSMWKEDVGEDYETKPPFEVANIAAHAATRWALAHPGITLRSVIKGQLSMLFAPDRSSWAPGVSFLHPGPLAFHVFAIVVSLFRLFLSCLAVVTLIRWRSLLRFRWLPIYFLFTIVAHVLGVGAVGEGRYIAPVSPFIDFLAALTLCATPYLRGRFSASTEPGALSPSPNLPQSAFSAFPAPARKDFERKP